MELLDVKNELENLTIMTNSKPDLKQELRNVLAGAGMSGLNGASWTIVLSDERMKELDGRGLRYLNAAGWNA